MAQIFAMPGSEGLADELAELTGHGRGQLEVRRFPDQETYVRVRSAVNGATVLLVCNLARPDPSFLGIVFAVRTLRELGAASVTLIAPYLPYLRQDRRFEEGEAVTSRVFADLLGRELDLLVTVDPHLHRYSSLDEIYSSPTLVLRSAPAIGRWVKENVPSPLILGPDAESEQWAKEIAEVAEAPWATFEKQRHGDSDVLLTAPPLKQWRGRMPVLVDDIVSSGGTILEAARLLRREGFDDVHCVAVHALFDHTVGVRLSKQLRSFVTTDTVPNRLAGIRVAPLLADGLRSTDGSRERTALGLGQESTGRRAC